MNLLHMKYALEVARQGSLSRAAEILHTAQPNISRAIKDLESDIGVTLFQRSKRGMMLTPEGEEFIGYAREVLSRLDEMESLYKQGIHPKRRLTLAAPRSLYIADALAALATELGEDPFDIVHREMPTRDILRAVEDGDVRLGVVRYAVEDDARMKTLLEEKGMTFEMVASFSPVLLLHREHPLAAAGAFALEALRCSVELAGNAWCEGGFVGERTDALAAASAQSAEPSRRILLGDHAASLAVLSRCRHAFLWSAPVSEEVCARYDLIMRRPTDVKAEYKDLLIYRDDHRLTREELAFITALCEARRRHIPS